jgi:hypothetical protein
MIDFDKIIKRMKQLSCLKTDRDVADLFGLSAQDFSRRKKQGTLLPLIVDWGIINNVDLDWLLKGKNNEDSDTISTNIVEMDHADLIRDFKDKQFAKEINIDLIKIERIDPEKFRETGFYIKGVANGLRTSEKKINMGETPAGEPGPKNGTNHPK